VTAAGIHCAVTVAVTVYTPVSAAFWTPTYSRRSYFEAPLQRYRKSDGRVAFPANVLSARNRCCAVVAGTVGWVKPRPSARDHVLQGTPAHPARAHLSIHRVPLAGTHWATPRHASTVLLVHHPCPRGTVML
jgi:hypothetical protein